MSTDKHLVNKEEKAETLSDIFCPQDVKSFKNACLEKSDPNNIVKFKLSPHSGTERDRVREAM
jgi:hypothetical protein